MTKNCLRFSDEKQFCPKIMVISKKKKKRSSPKFGLLFFAVPHRHLSKFPDFAQIFRIAARKILILPKSSKLGGAIAPCPPGRYGYGNVCTLVLCFGLT